MVYSLVTSPRRIILLYTMFSASNSPRITITDTTGQLLAKNSFTKGHSADWFSRTIARIGISKSKNPPVRML